MHDIFPYLIVLGILFGIIVAYVIYRLMTDRSDDSKPHSLYPLTSKPTDKAFPERHDYLGWLIYALLVIGIFGILLQIAANFRLIDLPESLIDVTGAAFLIGILLIVIRRLISKRRSKRSA